MWKAILIGVVIALIVFIIDRLKYIRKLKEENALTYSQPLDNEESELHDYNLEEGANLFM